MLATTKQRKGVTSNATSVCATASLRQFSPSLTPPTCSLLSHLFFREAPLSQTKTTSHLSFQERNINFQFSLRFCFVWRNPEGANLTIGSTTLGMIIFMMMHVGTLDRSRRPPMLSCNNKVIGIPWPPPPVTLKRDFNLVDCIFYLVLYHWMYLCHRS